MVLLVLLAISETVLFFVFVFVFVFNLASGRLCDELYSDPVLLAVAVERFMVRS